MTFPLRAADALGLVLSVVLVTALDVPALDFAAALSLDGCGAVARALAFFGSGSVVEAVRELPDGAD